MEIDAGGAGLHRAAMEATPQRAHTAPANSTSFSGFIVASAHSALNPASSSAFLTALKSFGAQLTSKLPSECVKTSCAPALSAASIKASSGVLGANKNRAQCLHIKKTEPF